MSNDGLEQILDHLKHIEQFQELLAELDAMADNAIEELRDCPVDDLPRRAGKIEAYREILSLMRT